MKTLFTLFLILTHSLALLPLLHAESRVFTNTNGQKIEATILEVKRDQVTIEKSGGSKFTVPITMFSADDQAWIKEWASRPRDLKPSVSAHGIRNEPGLAEYRIEEVKTLDDGAYWVYVPESYQNGVPMPLVLESHGNFNANDLERRPGELQIRPWMKLADQYGFIVVCPSFDLSCTRGKNFAESIGTTPWENTEEYIEHLMPRLFEAFSVDREKVMITGLSGGGYTCWLGLNYPDFFTTIVPRIPNISKRRAAFVKSSRLSKWKGKGRKAYYFHGASDSIVTPDQVEMGTDLLKKAFGKENVLIETHDMGHQGHPEYAAEWFAGEIMGLKIENPSPKNLVE